MTFVQAKQYPEYDSKGNKDFLSDNIRDLIKLHNTAIAGATSANILNQQTAYLLDKIYNQVVLEWERDIDTKYFEGGKNYESLQTPFTFKPPQIDNPSLLKHFFIVDGLLTHFSDIKVVFDLEVKKFQDCERILIVLLVEAWISSYIGKASEENSTKAVKDYEDILLAKSKDLSSGAPATPELPTGAEAIKIAEKTRKLTDAEREQIRMDANKARDVDRKAKKASQTNIETNAKINNASIQSVTELAFNEAREFIVPITNASRIGGITGEIVAQRTIENTPLVCATGNISGQLKAARYIADIVRKKRENAVAQADALVAAGTPPNTAAAKKAKSHEYDVINRIKLEKIGRTYSKKEALNEVEEVSLDDNLVNDIKRLSPNFIVADTKGDPDSNKRNLKISLDAELGRLPPNPHAPISDKFANMVYNCGINGKNEGYKTVSSKNATKKISDGIRASAHIKLRFSAGSTPDQLAIDTLASADLESNKIGKIMKIKSLLCICKYAWCMGNFGNINNGTYSKGGASNLERYSLQGSGDASALLINTFNLSMMKDFANMCMKNGGYHCSKDIENAFLFTRHKKNERDPFRPVLENGSVGGHTIQVNLFGTYMQILEKLCPPLKEIIEWWDLYLSVLPITDDANKKHTTLNSPKGMLLLFAFAIFIEASYDDEAIEKLAASIHKYNTEIFSIYALSDEILKLQIVEEEKSSRLISDLQIGIGTNLIEFEKNIRYRYGITQLDHSTVLALFISNKIARNSWFEAIRKLINKNKGMSKYGPLKSKCEAGLSLGFEIDDLKSDTKVKGIYHPLAVFPEAKEFLKEIIVKSKTEYDKIIKVYNNEYQFYALMQNMCTSGLNNRDISYKMLCFILNKFETPQIKSMVEYFIWKFISPIGMKIDKPPPGVITTTQHVPNGVVDLDEESDDAIVIKLLDRNYNCDLRRHAGNAPPVCDLEESRKKLLQISKYSLYVCTETTRILGYVNKLTDPADGKTSVGYFYRNETLEYEELLKMFDYYNLPVVSGSVASIGPIPIQNGSLPIQNGSTCSIELFGPNPYTFSFVSNIGVYEDKNSYSAENILSFYINRPFPDFKSHYDDIIKKILGVNPDGTLTIGYTSDFLKVLIALICFVLSSINSDVWNNDDIVTRITSSCTGKLRPKGKPDADLASAEASKQSHATRYAGGDLSTYTLATAERELAAIKKSVADDRVSSEKVTILKFLEDKKKEISKLDRDFGSISVQSVKKETSLNLIKSTIQMSEPGSDLINTGILSRVVSSKYVKVTITPPSAPPLQPAQPAPPVTTNEAPVNLEGLERGMSD